MLTYRKTKTGDWAVFGPAAELRVGVVTVTKKSGERKVETIKHASKSFAVDGVPHAYGYIAEKAMSGRGGYSGGSSAYCYYPCPVSGLKCCPENGPCHDCQ